MFLQRKHTGGQKQRKRHSTRLIIRNTNENYNGVSLHSSQNSHHQKVYKLNAGEDVEKQEPSCTVGGNVNWCIHCGKQYGGSTEN